MKNQFNNFTAERMYDVAQQKYRQLKAAKAPTTPLEILPRMDSDSVRAVLDAVGAELETLKRLILRKHGPRLSE